MISNEGLAYYCKYAEDSEGSGSKALKTGLGATLGAGLGIGAIGAGGLGAYKLYDKKSA